MVHLLAKFSTRTGLPKVLGREGASEFETFWLLGSVRDLPLDVFDTTESGLVLLDDDFFLSSGTDNFGPKTDVSIWDKERFLGLLTGFADFAAGLVLRQKC